jgi:hypothetical protein
MKTLRPAFLAFILPLLLAGQAVAQAQSQTLDDGNRIVGCPAYCYRVALPLGLYVQEVFEDGRYVMLEDQSVWEIRLPQRPVASAWKQGDFVVIRTIWAPVDGYETLLAHGDNDRAEARLAGRGQPPASSLPD